MNKILQLFIFITLSLVNSAVAAPMQNIVEHGNIVYCHKKGRIRCQSEINAANEITILLTCLDKNTDIEFQKVERLKKEGLHLKVIMFVDDSSICASWTDVQEVNLPIDPIPVTHFTLTGKQIYKSNGIRVLRK